DFTHQYTLDNVLGWGEDKIARLNEILDALVIININKPNVVENYARINYFSEKVMKPARPLGQNDIWIAATAKTVGAWLMTTDNDFDHLHPKYLKRILIDAKTGETIDRTS
ncbi:MAG TPA: PIN domain-containing protein, partial [Thiotrichaceae bacterium]|nr:PIN domain-containing protein [Thiotrichaceae bacterium]